MKRIFYSLFLMLTAGLSANSQWKLENVPHEAGDMPFDVEVPNAQTVWAALTNVWHTYYPNNRFYRTADGGATWDYGKINGPKNYSITSFAAIDADTCYAVMVNSKVYYGGGIFKTRDGGKNWKQLAVGQVFDSASFPDFIYFWNAKQGIAVGDANGPGEHPYMEIYTTNDYGKTWERTPKANMPHGKVYAVVNCYSVVGDRMWIEVVTHTSAYQVWRSDDRGMHWQAFPINTPNLYNDIAFTDSLKGVVVGRDGTGTDYVYNTKDGGKTWSGPLKYSGFLCSQYVEGVPGTSRLISTNNSGDPDQWGSSYSDDNGKTWTQIDNWPHSNLKFLDSTVGWSGEPKGDLGPGAMVKWTGPCGKPTHVTARNITSSSGKIKWNSVPYAAKYILQYRVQGTTTWTAQNMRDTFFVMRGLAGSTTYEYRVKAVCNVTGDVTTGFTPIATFTTIAFADNMVAGHGSGTITISPNPAQNNFVLQLNGSMNGKAAITIIDAAGKHVLSETRNASAGLNEFSVDISRLARGIYLVQIETNDQKVVKKLVKE